jgi:hypothetical protein
LTATQADFSARITDALAGLPSGADDEEAGGLIRYRALNLITGLRSQIINAGDEILADPGEVTELVEAGSLVTVDNE